MKNIDKNSVKYLIILIVTCALFGIILYPLFELIFCKLITHKEFVYSIYNHLVEPIIFALIFGITYWLTLKASKK